MDARIRSPQYRSTYLHLHDTKRSRPTLNAYARFSSHKMVIGRASTAWLHLKGSEHHIPKADVLSCMLDAGRVRCTLDARSCCHYLSTREIWIRVEAVAYPSSFFFNAFHARPQTAATNLLRAKKHSKSRR